MGIAYRSTLGEPPTGNAVVGDVLYGKTFSNADGTDKVGTMPNNGAVAPTALDPGGSYTIPAGYHNGQGAVSAKSNTATYTASSRGAALDMGAANLNRYVNTNGVPNSNTGTYTFPANDTGGTKDLGEANNYRYVNAQNVYNKGVADGGVSNVTIIGLQSTASCNFSISNAKVGGFYLLDIHSAYVPPENLTLSGCQKVNSSTYGAYPYGALAVLLKCTNANMTVANTWAGGVTTNTSLIQLS